MAAVVAPVSINHPQFGHSGLALFARKILLAKRKVGIVHRKAPVRGKRGARLGVHGAKPGKGFHRLRLGLGAGQRRFYIQRRAASLHRVDEVFFNRGKRLLAKAAGQQVNFCRAHHRPLALAEQLHALCGRICPLVKLAGQVFHPQHCVGPGGQCVVSEVKLRLAEHHANAAAEQLGRNALYIIAVEHPYAGQPARARLGAQLCQQVARLHGDLGPFFNINAIYHGSDAPFAAGAKGRQCPRADVAPVMCALKTNFCSALIRALHGLL